MERGTDPARLSDADLLAGRLGDIGATAGGIGAAAGGAPYGAGGGRAGARLAARLLRSRHHEADYVADAPVAETAEALSRASSSSERRSTGAASAAAVRSAGWLAPGCGT
jgi:hypothetical protein